ncbi:hypothetical protein Talka_01934 [Tepidimonas alkaliphilus]|uniref:Egg lysin n=1 Tax=Tepidimonas alkaliphilus TaxID=2588942 RepID=A0A554W516_9BURK|nr:DUF3422 domain-containing protein [Tepidimonas alkaliphilus]TSE18643.1 hypothetical protein Talka_01934 [Tepidimonas alkaliphilus]
MSQFAEEVCRVDLPPDDDRRRALHEEIHARPAARIRLPALVVYVAVLNEDVKREHELAHLRQLPGQQHLTLDDLSRHFLRLRCGGYTLKWERHTEFTRYSLVQPLPAGAGLGARDPVWQSQLLLPPGWLAAIPGRTIAAVELAMDPQPLDDPPALLERARVWFDGRPIVASLLGNPSHSLVVTDFHLRPDGFERMLVLAPSTTSETRAGRISARLLELETYRMMALLGLPVAKGLLGPLARDEVELARLTAAMEAKAVSDQVLLDALVALAARVERSIAEHGYRFSATRAYDRLVQQRIGELRERPIPGTQTISEFMQRRLAPAIATVASVEQRLGALSGRVTRTSALLRTRVDIAREEQNRVLLEKLTRGQALQLRLQTTVEGLSIAAISYYVISLVLYGAKALKSAGVPLHPELAAGLAMPLVLWAVWRINRRIHDKLHAA